MPVSSETALAVKALARQHQEAIWARQHTVNRLRSVLLEYYPNALHAFPNLTHRAVLTILAAVPSPARAAKLNIKKTVVLLRPCGRGDRPGLAEQIVRDLTAATLRQPLAVEEALATATVGLVSVITAMETVIAELEVAMTTEFDRHRHSDLLRSVRDSDPSWPLGAGRDRRRPRHRQRTLRLRRHLPHHTGVRANQDSKRSSHPQPPPR